MRGHYATVVPVSPEPRLVHGGEGGLARLVECTHDRTDDVRGPRDGA
jgi:hypothetical protein